MIVPWKGANVSVFIDPNLTFIFPVSFFKTTKFLLSLTYTSPLKHRKKVDIVDGKKRRKTTPSWEVMMSQAARVKELGGANNFRNPLEPTAFMWLAQRHRVVMIKTGTRTCLLIPGMALFRH